jgi:thiamine-monophosphate kinase
VDEFELIQRYFVREDEAPGVIVGIGDDGAVLEPHPGREIITVIDTLVEDVHFPAGIAPADLGYRAVAVNLSDIAAMGGRPLWMTLALTVPGSDEAWIGEFARGLHEAAAEHGVSLVGGDMTRGESVVTSVQISGDVDAGKAILRAGARPGDTVYVTGTFGDGAAGLALLQSGSPDEWLSSRYLRPTARVDFGMSMHEFANAAIDVSDGLVGDLRKLLGASGVGAEIDVSAVPLSPALQAAFDASEQRDFALTGGDDYELCFTSSSQLPETITSVPVTAIGTITDGDSLVCHDTDGIVEIDDSGYRHF